MNYKGLINLDLSNNQIIDLAPISKLRKIKVLNVSNNPINNINPIYHIKNLTSLNLRNTNVENLKEINQLKNLNEIYLDEHVNRQALNFLIGNFKNADIYTKSYLITKEIFQ